MTSAATLAANNAHASHVSTTETTGDFTVASGSAPTVGFEVRPAIVVPHDRPGD
ncbi:hypothetical protein HTIA_0479 [Halorhabdus tiamatea SARL4B]|uniref:Uncharacterized protein n=1 Tax=Halorhabdus tiamatea SARL4B TaxID=1033806 RepID=S6CSE4_9EURY|nr:hypothetical protein HTIA_0479 [Halorhabdus tiamatea SARL4B]